MSLDGDAPQKPRSARSCAECYTHIISSGAVAIACRGALLCGMFGVCVNRATTGTLLHISYNILCHTIYLHLPFTGGFDAITTHKHTHRQRAAQRRRRPDGVTIIVKLKHFVDIF